MNINSYFKSETHKIAFALTEVNSGEEISNLLGVEDKHFSNLQCARELFEYHLSNLKMIRDEELKVACINHLAERYETVTGEKLDV